MCAVANRTFYFEIAKTQKKFGKLALIIPAYSLLSCPCGSLSENLGDNHSKLSKVEIDIGTNTINSGESLTMISTALM